MELLIIIRDLKRSVVTVNDILSSNFYEGKPTQGRKIAIGHFLGRLTKKLEKLAGEPVADWKRFRGSGVDQRQLVILKDLSIGRGGNMRKIHAFQKKKKPEKPVKGASVRRSLEQAAPPEPEETTEPPRAQVSEDHIKFWRNHAQELAKRRK